MTNRRSVLSSLAAIPLLGSGCASPPAERTTFVLVHGAWHGAWCWERVTPLLREKGHVVYTPTLAGLGERRSELSATITLETHIAEVARFLVEHDLSHVTLVGHSYAGAVITGVADREHKRIGKLLYLDSLVFNQNESLSSFLGPERWAQFTKAAQEHGQGVGIPALPPIAFGVVDPQDQAYVAQRTTPQPINTFTDKLQLAHPFGNGLPKVYIDCDAPGMAAVAPFKARIRTQPGWQYTTMSAGHDVMVTAPAKLAELLLAHA